MNNDDRFLLNFSDVSFIDEKGNPIPDDQLSSYFLGQKSMNNEKTIFLPIGSTVSLKATENIPENNIVVISYQHYNDSKKMYHYAGFMVLEGKLSNIPLAFNNSDIETVHSEDFVTFFAKKSKT